MKNCHPFTVALIFNTWSNEDESWPSFRSNKCQSFKRAFSRPWGEGSRVQFNTWLDFFMFQSWWDHKCRSLRENRSSMSLIRSRFGVPHPPAFRRPLFIGNGVTAFTFRNSRRSPLEPGCSKSWRHREGTKGSICVLPGILAVNLSWEFNCSWKVRTIWNCRT